MNTKIIQNIIDNHGNLTENEVNNLKSWVKWFDISGLELKCGDLVQIDPQHSDIFGGHFLVVTEVLNYGAKGYIQYLKKNFAVKEYKIHYKNCCVVGTAKWVK